MSDATDREEMPEGWLDSTIGALATLSPRHARDLRDDTMVTFVPMAGLSQTSPTFAFTEERPLGEVRKGFTHFGEGDVLFAKITPCMENGKAAVATDLRNGLGCGTTELHVLRPSRALLPNYLYHYLHQESLRRDAASHFSGSAGQSRVPADFIRDCSIPLPPLAEQMRIIAAVEELLKRLEAVRTRLARVPVILRRFRQAILTAACNGELTADWRATYDCGSFRQTLEKILSEHRLPETEVLRSEGVTEDWVWTTIGALAIPTLRGRPYVTSGSRSWSRFVGSRGAYFVRSENINTDELRLLEDVRVQAPSGAEADRTTIRNGDILITITGNNVGKVAVVPDDCPVAHVSQHVAIVRLHMSIFTKYVWLWLQSAGHGQSQLEEFFYGQTKPGLNLEQVKSIRLALPPRAEQEEIVRRVDALLATVARIERRVAAAKVRTDRLAQAILTKAFRGELVQTEAEVARAEGREYESATALLERVAAIAPVGSPIRRRKKAKRATTR